MFSKFIIIFLVCLPLSEVFAAKTETLHQEAKGNSNSYYNLALKNFNAKNLGFAKAYIERSLYLNPLSTSSHNLNALINNKLTESLGGRNREVVSSLSRMLDFIPSTFSYVILIVALFLISLSLAKLHFVEKSSFKDSPHLRIRTAGFAFLLFCSFLLFLTKEQSASKDWACVTSAETALFTGPKSEGYVQTGSLQLGSCVEAIKIFKDWISLKPTNSPSGWARRSDIMLVRGYKIDPPKNSD